MEEEEIVEGLIVGVPEPRKVEQNNENRIQAIMVNYDEENVEVENEGAMQAAISALKGYPWSDEDLPFYFSQVEIKMKSAGVKKNFTKLQVLSTILPRKAIEDIKEILRKQEDQFPQKDAYLQAKRELLETFGQGENARYERAMGRVLTGKPSQLAKALIDDLCDCRLDGCCCYRFVYGTWLKQLPSAVKQAISGMKFDKANLKTILKKADDTWQSTRPASATVAAVAAIAPDEQGAPEVLDTAFTLPPENAQTAALTASVVQQATAQIAALYSARGRGNRGWRGGRNNRGRFQNRGGNRGNGRGGNNSNNTNNQNPYSATNPRHKTPRHPDQPPWGACKRHWTYGKSSFCCLEPDTCPWSQYITPQASN